MGGCSLLPGNSSRLAHSAADRNPEPVKSVHDSTPDRVTIEDREGRVEVQKVELRPGVSSTTVERLAKRYGCTGSAGAGLLTAKGPVEVYRMQCDNGKSFTARCELRQCRPMR